MARAPAVAEVEDYPEADRLGGFPHPRHTVSLYGQERAERALVEAFRSGRMHHAWLLSGRAGIGKATLAYRMARHVLAAPHERDAFGASLETDAECGATRQVRALSHPGLLVVRRAYLIKEKRLPATIPVDEVRRLRAFLGHTGDAAGWRAVIVDSADELNASAANALLKSLEEPPPRTLFLLITAAPGRLLTTLRSRCRTLDLAPLGEADLRRAVAQAMAASGEEVTAPPPSGRDWDALARLSGGSVRRCLGLQASGGLDLYRAILRIVSGLPAIDWAAAHKLSDELGGAAAEQRFELFFDLMLGLLGRLVEAAAGGPAEAGEGELSARLIGGEGRLASWAGLWETVVADKAQVLALNLDRKSLVLETLSRLEAAARRP